ncbi:MAG: hypothetical protein M3126_11235 [Candidatus Eremiobacteraeota bacterium]|nr:hypothetical protein [Candidatus Eremiobacteraeota bacterium]
MLASSFLLFAAALNVAVTAAPTPSPAGALREIGHVRSTAFCSELALHANTAISAALRNDTVLVQTIDRMQNARLDGNSITRRNTLQSLGDLAKELRARAVAGNREAATLRTMAGQSTDPEQKEELKRFADALGGALYRQKQVANDLNGLLAAFDYHDMRPTATDLASMNGGRPIAHSVFPEDPKFNAYSARSQSDPFNRPLTDTDLAAIAAKDFQARIPDISNDEGIASNHAVGATSGC